MLATRCARVWLRYRPEDCDLFTHYCEEQLSSLQSLTLTGEEQQSKQKSYFLDPINLCNELLLLYTLGILCASEASVVWYAL